MVKYQAAAARPHLCRARRPHPAGPDRAARARGRHVGQRARPAVSDLAAGRHEASRRAVRCRPDHPQEDRPHRHLPARPLRPWSKRCTGSTATSASGRNSSIGSPLLWRKNHARPSKSRHQAKPHPQTSSQCAAGKSLRRLDRPRKSREVVRPRRRSGDAGRDRCPGRRPLRLTFHTEDGERAPRQRRLSGGRAEPEARLHLGLAHHAGARSRW